MTHIEKIVRVHMAQQGYVTKRELCMDLGMDERLLHKRLRQPETFRVFELRVMADVLHLSYEELLDIVLGREGIVCTKDLSELAS